MLYFDGTAPAYRGDAEGKRPKVTARRARLQRGGKGKVRRITEGKVTVRYNELHSKVRARLEKLQALVCTYLNLNNS